MVSIYALWLPILVSAVVVFFLSYFIHMVLGYHKNDFKGLSSENQIMDDLRKYNIPSGDYHFPHPKDMKEMQSPEFIDKMKKGPVGFITIMNRNSISIAKQLVMWFIYCLVVGIFAAYIVSRRVDPGEDYLTIFRFVVVTAFAGYSLALLQKSIWFGRKWSTTFKSVFDGLIYALVTAGIFGWLWPTI